MFTKSYDKSIATLIGSAVLPVLGLIGVCQAGPLAPSVGPVASTHKTLTEVEPRIAINATNTPGDADSLFKITQPGSYYLTGNITGVVGKSGIEITASNVTIDLGGFVMTGAAGALDGIVSTVSLQKITIVNGVVASWPGDGIDLISTGNIVLRDVLARDNGTGSTGSGIRTGINTLIEACSASSNARFGFDALDATRVVDSAAHDNGNNGFDLSSGGVISGCISRANGGIGFRLGNDGSISRSTARENDGVGISIGEGSMVLDCVSSVNAVGIVASFRCAVIGNICRSNTGAASLTGAGIRIIGTDTRVEGNTTSTNTIGVDITNSSNIVIRNVAASNSTNWNIVGGNHYGPIIDRTAVAAPPAVVGNAASSALGTTDPNANFTY